MNDECSTDSDCKFIQEGRCYLGYCSCRHGYVLDTIETSLATSTAGSSGEINEEYLQNITLNSTYVTSKCIPNYLNYKCVTDENCLPENSKCLQNTCQCPTGYYKSRKPMLN